MGGAPPDAGGLIALYGRSVMGARADGSGLGRDDLDRAGPEDQERLGLAADGAREEPGNVRNPARAVTWRHCSRTPQD
jgi:hypothetical protein